MTRKKAISIGDNCIDNYVRPAREPSAGGNAVNVSVHLKDAGVPSAYLGAVGDDAPGRWIVEQLRAQGVDVSHVHVLPGRTARSDVALDGVERIFLAEDAGVGMDLRLDANDFEFIAKHTLAHWSVLGPGLEAIGATHGRGVLTSLDYSSPDRYDEALLRETLPDIDYAFFSGSEIGNVAAAEAFARAKLALGPRLVVVTRGVEGSLAVDRRGAYYESAVPVEVVDTLGAGDAFIGWFLACRLLGRAVPDCLSAAAARAAQVCTHLGAWRPAGVEPPARGSGK